MGTFGPRTLLAAVALHALVSSKMRDSDDIDVIADLAVRCADATLERMAFEPPESETPVRLELPPDFGLG